MPWWPSCLASRASTFRSCFAAAPCCFASRACKQHEAVFQNATMPALGSLAAFHTLCAHLMNIIAKRSSVPRFCSRCYEAPMQAPEIGSDHAG